jgi:hypothetical protein
MKEREDLKEEKFIGKALELYSLSSIEKDKLKQRIVESGGKIRLIVHPFHDSEGDYGEEINEREVLLRTRFEKTVASKDEKSLPIFLFIDWDVFDSTTAYLDDLGIAKDVYLVATDKEETAPIKTGKGADGVRFPLHETHYQYEWFDFKKVLKGCGVREILMDGMKLEIDKKPIHCMGTTIMNLRSEFSVDVGGMVSPDRRNDYKKWESGVSGK